MTVHKRDFPRWVNEFYDRHGVMPIAGGSDTSTAQDQGNQDQTTPAPQADPQSGFPHYEPTQPQPFDPNQQTQNPATGRTFTEEELERARQQEREKVYSRLEQEQQQRQTLEERIQQMEQEREEERQRLEEQRQQEEQEAQKQQEEQRKQEEAELTELQRLQKQQEELQQQFEQEQQQRKQQEIMLQKERELNALNEYKQQRVHEAQEEIAPQFLDYVQGDSPEEIDQAIETAKAKTAEIMTEFQQAQQSQRQAAQGVRATAPPVGPAEGFTGERTFSLEEIQAMTPSEYAKYRGQLQQAAKQGGLYG